MFENMVSKICGRETLGSTCSKVKVKTCERYVLKGQIKKVNFVSGVVHCWGDRQKVQKAYIGISCLKPS